ncbi:DUF3572 domain-containing protein [Prosthecomicrobium hirschii]|uniref:DUF3572 domain-containing protein n=1 Tax=Prosthecodimorpha hirschii TaxID=665126 RepID=A0A0P6VVZ0_9HYPH|nr:DUF3572 domain-containing protein [Prosthecomicrobium hirschii]KPL51045.1 hypothetical protein ABB55_01425 [Prosthecomicrobium hirschii]MCW1839123.1 DUF3572 domain-containing protein [Prosthecomicrobium hirschii]TPQ52485.1 DUF3572 domain-containing protein [Prosthecomicrobium hirschii]
MNHDEAEGIAIAALGFLAERPEHLGRFLAESGIGPETLRVAATDPGFLAGILDFLMNDESLLLEFTENRRLRPLMVAAAHHRLSGPHPE